MILDLLLRQFYVLAAFLLVSSISLSYIFTKLFTNFAKQNNIVDDPTFASDRKKQTKAVPLFVGSGFCLVASAIMATIALMSYFNIFNFNLFITEPNWAIKTFYIILAVILLLIGGLLDDLRKLRPIHQGFFVFGAVALVVFGGNILIFDGGGSNLLILLSKIYNWFLNHNLIFFSDILKEIILNFNPLILNQIITFVWLIACISATKFLDGHDGLVSSIGLVGFLSIASVALFDYIQQPLLSLFALVWVFSLIGFLPFNFPSAKVYLGEGASYVIGFMIGVLSIMSESKTLLGTTVIGLFIVDLMLVWGLRILQKRNPLTSADRLHWHHRLEQIGFSKLQVLIITVFLTLLVTHLYFWFRASLGVWILVIEISIILFLFGVWILKKAK